MLRIVLLLAALSYAGDGTPLVMAYMRASCEIAKQEFQNRPQPLCDGPALVENRAALIQVADSFLTKSISYIKAVAESGAQINGSAVRDTLAFYDSIFVAMIPINKCLPPYKDSASAARISGMFDLASLEIALIAPARLLTPNKKYTKRAGLFFDLMGRDPAKSPREALILRR